MKNVDGGIKMSVGNNIATLRKSAKLTQEQLAEKCNVSRQAVAKWETGESEPTIERLIMLSNIFGVTVDEMIKANQDQYGIKNVMENEQVEKIFHNIQRGIHNLHLFGPYFTESLSLGEQQRLYCMQIFYNIIVDRFLDANNKIYDKYLLCNTTKEERKKYTFGLSGADYSVYFESIDRYVNGEIEIDEALAPIEEEISKHLDIESNKFRNESDNQNWKCFVKIRQATWDLGDWDEYSSKKQKEIIENFSQYVHEIDTNTYIGRLLKLVGEEVLVGLKNGDVNTAIKLEKYHNILEAYIRAITYDFESNNNN